ncbi:MAG: hypothetical protein HRU24_13125 [Gammaproteobacteria bacterium]|nr:hypothetical protein [Gammaproteobacteria bacterium]
MNLSIKKLSLIFLLSSLINTASAQINELKFMVRTVYPDELSNVKELIEYIVEGTGYRVYIGRNSPDDAKAILLAKIGFQRKNLLMSKTDALLMAIGNKNTLVIDYDNKLISATRSPNYDF